MTTFDAIRDNDIATITALISNGELDFSGSPSPLQYASKRGRLEIIALLLDAGADIDAVDEHGQTACHFAVRYREIDALRFLLARGANVNANTTRRLSLLRAAAESYNNDRAVVELLDAGASFDNLSDADLIGLMAESQSVAVLERLVARDVDVSELRDAYGFTILHLLDRYFNHTKDFIRALVRLGVDVNSRDHEGQTPLHCAAMLCNVDLVQNLVAFGANGDQQDARGETALLSSWNTSCTPLLLTLNTDVTLATVEGKTACHFAAERGSNGFLLCVVVALGGDLDQPDNEGETPRMIATRRGFSLPTTDEIDAARRKIAKDRLDLVRTRALEICVGLQSLEINALQLCEIMTHSFGMLGLGVAFHHWWAIATTVKHFRAGQQQ